jgi:hypothetical protein
VIARYLVVAGRIRQEVANLERVVTRAERAVAAVRQRPEDQDLYLDAAALNLHDFYAGLERVFHHIAAARAWPISCSCRRKEADMATGEEIWTFWAQTRREMSSPCDSPDS